MISEETIQHQGRRFDPYEFNAGTSLAINMNDYLILATDTRHSSEMGINTRNISKIYFLDDLYLIVTGFYADGYEVYINLLYQLIEYESKNNKKMGIRSAAHLLHNLLYRKRFFPYYSYCILGGFDKKSQKFLLFSFDVVGSYGETVCRVDGSGTTMIQPLLDSRISKLNWENNDTKVTDCKEVCELVKIAFKSAAERDVKTGDYLDLVVVKKDGIERTLHKLRHD
ncbi:hypothetical protein EDEG_03753 [Edhazardia aedis USNM 41457]|uniref:Proteasome subunit beta n=1 Tax=Edhazardia aedis (strain USNM 41457) TaxID=1003232 RepID=J8ZPV7_EDHAE|nr:hypothetical protein EDEG_03753 [Edhazardia aedis USNM 41457]|eukprot:EJW01728.1 hypothetical protein EDEG_03753 [Edhazardia aedis USNM 41457]